MKMKITIYRLNKDENQAFTIQENDERRYSNDGKFVDTGRRVFSIWHDPYEGGFTYDSEWINVDNGEYPNLLPDTFESFDKCYKWITDNYGDITDVTEEIY